MIGTRPTDEQEHSQLFFLVSFASRSCSSAPSEACWFTITGRLFCSRQAIKGECCHCSMNIGSRKAAVAKSPAHFLVINAAGFISVSSSRNGHQRIDYSCTGRICQ
jgi:hypothetical protein